MRVLRSRIALPAIALSASLGAIFLTGCGAGSPAASLSSTTLGGKVYGGSNPISGATVRLYSTGTGSYGAAGTLLATATTGSDGGFSFSNAGTCASPAQEYITTTGGNPGAGANPNYLLMAALGNCSTINTNTSIWVDELSTVAAAYSLANFISINGTTVNIGAPVNASLATGSCINTATTSGTGGATVTVNTISSCQTAGLAHAFANAANLVNTVGTNAAPPNGQAFAVPPSNANGEVPQALLNTLGNILVACVNSSGSGAACSSLFSATTPTGGTAPTNTLQALVNLAKNPTMNTSTLYGIVPPQMAYSPALTAQPTDFSVALVYKGVTVAGTTTAFGYPRYVALDANDNAYVSATDASSATKAGVAAVGFDGTSLFAPTFGTTYKVPRTLAVDNLGNVWVANNGTSTAAVLQYSTTATSAGTAYGTTTQYPYGLAIDKRNNVWYGLSTPSTAALNNLIELNASSSYAPATFTTPAMFAAGPYGIAVDAQQNIWTANGFPTSASSSVGLFPNTGTAAAPAYAQPAIENQVTGGTAQYAGVTFDSAGGAYIPLTAGSTAKANLVKATPNSTTTPTSFTVSPASTTLAAAPQVPATDGKNVVWVTDFSSTSSQIVSYPTTGSGVAIALAPCRAGNGATTCGTSLTTGGATAPAIYNPRVVQIDSAGDIWTVSSTSGLLVEVLGTAAPTWPLLAYGQPGITPQ